MIIEGNGHEQLVCRHSAREQTRRGNPVTLKGNLSLKISLAKYLKALQPNMTTQKRNQATTNLLGVNDEQLKEAGLGNYLQEPGGQVEVVQIPRTTFLGVSPLPKFKMPFLECCDGSGDPDDRLQNYKTSMRLHGATEPPSCAWRSLQRQEKLQRNGSITYPGFSNLIQRPGICILQPSPTFTVIVGEKRTLK